MDGTMWLLDKVFTFWVQLAILCPEVVVDRCALEYALLDAFFLARFVVIYLYNDTKTLYKEYATKDR